jgi:PleD family two-component response regulator
LFIKVGHGIREKKRKPLSSSALSKICDSLLYKAKKSGRNRCACGSLSSLIEES